MWEEFWEPVNPKTDRFKLEGCEDLPHDVSCTTCEWERIGLSHDEAHALTRSHPARCGPRGGRSRVAVYVTFPAGGGRSDG